MWRERVCVDQKSYRKNSNPPPTPCSYSWHPHIRHLRRKERIEEPSLTLPNPFLDYALTLQEIFAPAPTFSPGFESVYTVCTEKFLLCFKNIIFFQSCGGNLVSPSHGPSLTRPKFHSSRSLSHSEHHLHGKEREEENYASSLIPPEPRFFSPSGANFEGGKGWLVSVAPWGSQVFQKPMRKIYCDFNFCRFPEDICMVSHVSSVQRAKKHKMTLLQLKSLHI